mmetsp:Transcript_42207/g.88592  ORF Transcript_42207/g.88592 Transcript_42207/m.88592 type:complete len:129 (+) Transcript_42207:596-982(+)
MFIVIVMLGVLLHRGVPAIVGNDIIGNPLTKTEDLRQRISDFVGTRDCLWRNCELKRLSRVVAVVDATTSSSSHTLRCVQGWECHSNRIIQGGSWKSYSSNRHPSSTNVAPPTSTTIVIHNVLNDDVS